MIYDFRYMDEVHVKVSFQVDVTYLSRWVQHFFPQTSLIPLSKVEGWNM